ncbi:hypothetical protein ASF37_11690 [Aeromicrobium sp. Leaf289]|uniref:hypothetical protein n=1 Tax=Aeromicrobium sp. Leaf289 TaxID=1736324 RepID=UPI0006F7EB36|nr:hypothetical protein [Aeromicrobium sp. Leaf289]KQP77219.1 hypothetical protein ASF37_11690 [Aeromicrobium sp. Leaf289]
MTQRNAKVILDADVSRYNRAVLGAVATTKAFTKELDTSTDRSANLVQGLLAVGPALVPIATSAVPALASLSNQLALTAGAAGVAVIAFSGVGEALKAVNDFQIEPSAANFAKLEESMASLGPAGRDFVGYLQSIRPELQRLQDVAQEGMFPGMQVGISELMTQLPQAERIVGQIAEALGQLSAEAGTELAGPRWEEFFNFLETEAQDTLMDLGRTVGNLTDGFAQLWMAFAPVSANFSDSFLRMSQDFASWASSVDETQGFEDFLAYLDRTGPKVWDTLGALGNALLQVAEAAAPVGEAALPVIELLADGIASIADSDVGPVLIGVAAGISAISRAVALYNVANGSALATLLGGSSFGGAARSARDLRGASSAYLDFGAALGSAGPQVGKFATTTERLRASMGGVGRVTAGLGALAFAASDLDDNLGLANTAMFTLAGAALGPLGAAAGAALGITRDLSASTDALSTALDNANRAADGGSIEQRREAMAALREEVDKARDGEAGMGQRIAEWAEMSASGGTAVSGLAAVVDRFTTSSSEAGGQLGELEEKHAAARRGAQDQMFAEAGLSDAMDSASSAARDSTEALLDNAAAKNAARDAALEGRAAERDFEAALDDAAKAARENKPTLNIDLADGRENQEALDRIASSWSRVDDATKNIPGRYERARASFIEIARAMGRSRAQAEALADDLLSIPPRVSSRFTLYGAPEAGSALQGILNRINALPSQKTIGIKVVGGTTTRQADGGFWDVKARADGGFDEYGRAVARTPQMRSGSQGVVMWGEPETRWEAYISGKPGMEEQNIGVLMQAADRLGVLDRLNARRFADGALATRGISVSPVQSATPFVASVAAEVNSGQLAAAVEKAVTRSLRGATWRADSLGNMRLHSMGG